MLEDNGLLENKDRVFIREQVERVVSELKPKSGTKVSLAQLWMFGYLFAIGFTGVEEYLSGFGDGFSSDVWYLFCTYALYPVAIGEKLVELLQ